jgi:hypothetical protein
MRTIIISLSIAIACASAPGALAQEKRLAADYAKMLKYLDAVMASQGGDSLVLEGDRFVPRRQAELTKLAQTFRAHATKHGLDVQDIDFVAGSYAFQAEVTARRSFVEAYRRAAEMLRGYQAQHEGEAAEAYTQMVPVVSSEGMLGSADR